MARLFTGKSNFMGIWTKIILLIVVLHFVVGFGFLIYKLSPPGNKTTRKKQRDA